MKNTGRNVNTTGCHFPLAVSPRRRAAVSFRSSAPRSRRGVALLLVMVTLVVCSILTAGFLSSQGTSIGIARNERDAEKARAIAQSGLELCTWLIKNRSDWRTAMSPGTWLNNYAIGEGTVNVAAASGDGTSSFNNDTTQPAVLTAVGSYGSRIFTLTATLGPTGGGTVFRGGNYTIGAIAQGASGGGGSSRIDSYNSSIANYSIVIPGLSAVFGNNFNASPALAIYGTSLYTGSFVVSKGGNPASAVFASILINGPSSISQATQTYTPGSIVLPNLTGLVYQGEMNRTFGSTTFSTPGIYDTITASGVLFTTNIKIGASGTYHITGNVSLNSLSALVINSGVKAAIVVDGNVTLSSSGAISLASSATLTLYVAGSVTLSNTTSINSSGNTANFTLLGTRNNSSIQLKNSALVYGAIYAPTASVTFDNTSQFFGAIIAKDLTLLSASQFHHDLALQTKRIDNITGGSAPQGTANYNLTILSSGH
jgi:Tfp pilus assembly protein PilX